MRFEVSLSSLLETIVDNVPKFFDAPNPPPPRFSSDDGDPADEYIYLKSIQTRNKEPYNLVGVHLAKQIFDMAPDAFRSRTALPILYGLNDVTIDRAHQTLVIGSADMEAAHLLKIHLNAPTAEVHCALADDNNVAIYVAEIIYRGDCIKFDIEILQ